MGIFNLTESEKKEILNLHNNAKLLKEQSTPPLDDKAKIMKIQTLLNTKYKAGLKVDGILGQNTLTALSNAMKATQASADKFKETFSQMSKNAENLPKTIFGTNTDTGTQVAAPASGTTAPAATTTAAPASGTTAPAATTTAAPATGTEAPTTAAAPTTQQAALSPASQQALSGQLTPQQIRQQARFDQRLARQARRNQRRAGQQ